MKIIKTSNFDLDDYPEEAIAEGIMDRALAEDAADALNKLYSMDSAAYYTVVEDDYKLNSGFKS